VGCLGGKKLGSEVARRLVIGIAALSGFSVFELGVGW
jgi:hypothetical protein